MGNSPADSAPGKLRSDQLMAQAEADRAARLAGRKSLFRRLLEGMRPDRQEPGGDSHSSYGTGAVICAALWRLAHRPDPYQGCFRISVKCCNPGWPVCGSVPE
jgi:hypothetical protein